MARVTIRDVGAIGVNKDKPSHELPPNAWTTLYNVRASDGHLSPIRGETMLATEPLFNPLNIFYCPSSIGQAIFLYAGVNQIAAYSSEDGHVDITPGSGMGTASTQNNWTGSWLNGVFVLNSRGTQLLVWDDIKTATPVDMKFMSTIPETEFVSTWRFNSVRAYKEILIGIGLKAGNAEYPTTVAWSGPATAGTVPTAWDPANRNNIAGERPLSGTSGKCIDGMQLGNNFIICKEDATILATFAQGSSALVFRSIDNNSGVVALNCMIEYLPGKMLIFNQNYDVMVTEGTQVVSIVDGKLLRYLQSRVNNVRDYQCFVLHHFLRKEVWICYPIVESEVSDGALACQEALVWNYVNNTFSFCALGRLTGATRGSLNKAAPIVDSVDTFIDETDELINTEFGKRKNNLLGCSFVRDKILELDIGNTIDSVPTVATIERQALAVIGQDLQGNIKVDHQLVKIIESIWPVFELLGTTYTVNITVGAQEFRDGPIVLDGPYMLEPGLRQEMDFCIEGIYITITFTIATGQLWKLHAYSIELSTAGDSL